MKEASCFAPLADAAQAPPFGGQWARHAPTCSCLCKLQLQQGRLTTRALRNRNQSHLFLGQLFSRPYTQPSPHRNTPAPCNSLKGLGSAVVPRSTLVRRSNQSTQEPRCASRGASSHDSTKQAPLAPVECRRPEGQLKPWRPQPPVLDQQLLSRSGIGLSAEKHLGPCSPRFLFGTLPGRRKRRNGTCPWLPIPAVLLQLAYADHLPPLLALLLLSTQLPK